MDAKTSTSSQIGAEIVVQSLEMHGVTHVFGVPGAKIDEEIRNEVPMMNVTAMVSPSARPSASITPPIKPTRV